MSTLSTARRVLGSTPMRLLLFVVIAVGLVYVVPRLGGTESVATPTTSPPAKASAAPVTGQIGPVSTFSDGVYEVGRDIPPGRYAAPGGSPTVSCYWERTSDPSAGMDGVLDNDRTRGGQVIVTVKAGEFLKVEDCGTWTKR